MPTFTPSYTGEYHGGESYGMDPYGDPTANAREAWRLAHGGGAKIGSTPAQRAGAVPGYVPGRGAVAGGGSSSLTPQATWDAQFRPHLNTGTTSTGAGMDPYAMHPGVSNPPPMTNFLPGDSGTASLAPHVSAPSNWQAAVNPAANSSTAANYPNILAANRAAYAPGGMMDNRANTPLQSSFIQGELDKAADAGIATTPAGVAAIGAKYGGGNATPGSITYAKPQINPAELVVKKAIPAVDNTSAGMDPYA